MSRQLVLFILVSPLLVTFLVSTTSFQSISFQGSLNSFDEVNNSTAYVSVPFHYQRNDYYCGPAALEMVFDYYGEDIPQPEIADVARTYPYVTYTDELRRAAHFSNLSVSLGDEMLSNITGYSARKVGYAAFEQWGLTIDNLKTLINERKPLIVLMWWTPSKVYGHYRVVVGYNETHVITHDPWNKDIWGGTYGGANTSMVYSTFLDLWEYSGNWGLIVHPWEIRLQMPGTVNRGDDFEVIANVTYPCSAPFDTASYPASSCKASIELQEGVELVFGENTQHFLGNIVAGNSIQTSWSIHARETGFHNISVTVTGIVQGDVGAHETYPPYNYEDEIGGSSTNSFSIVNQTCKVHNIDSGKNFSTIQEAINDNETLDGHTIFVEGGMYYEHVVANKTISLIGENRSITVIDGNMSGVSVSIWSSNVTVSGFTIRNGDDFGVAVFSDSCLIHNNIITNNQIDGVIIVGTDNMITDNMIANNSAGVNISLGGGNNTISGNIIASNLYVGVSIAYVSSGNKIFHNNFIDNSLHASASSSNTWDDGSRGNYWSDYEERYPNATEIDGSGIWDTPYEINERNIDRYPIVPEFPSFLVLTLFMVTTFLAVIIYRRQTSSYGR